MIGSWTINGVDTKVVCGLVLDTISGWRDAPSRRRAVANVPGVPGEIVLDAVPPEAARTLVATGTIVGTDVNDARAKLDLLIATLAAPTLAVIFFDATARQVNAELVSCIVAAPAAQMIARKIPVTITLVAHDPFAYDTGQSAVGLIVAGTAIPLGTGPVGPVIQIGSGSGSSGANPVLTFKDSTAAVIGSLTLTVAFAAADIIFVDCAKKTIVLNGVSRLDLLTAGDFVTLDVARHGNFAASQWPTIASSIAATAITTARYNKAWRG